MSCYIVSSNVMHRCAAAMMLFAAEHPDVPVDAFNPTDVDFTPLPNDGTSWGNRLYAMNAAAFLARYEGRHGSGDALPPYTFQPWPLRAPDNYPCGFERISAEFKFPLTELYRGLENLLYQCDEGNIPDSPLYKAVQEVCDKVAHLVADASPAVKAIPYGDMPAIPKPPSGRLAKPATNTRPADPGTGSLKALLGKPCNLN